MTTKKTNLAGKLETEEVFIIGNDPNQKQVKMSWLEETDYKTDIEKMRSEEGKYGKIVKAFMESSERFAKIECVSPSQAVSILNSFRVFIRKGEKWKARTHKNFCYVEKLEA